MDLAELPDLMDLVRVTKIRVYVAKISETLSNAYAILITPSHKVYNLSLYLLYDL